MDILLRPICRSACVTHDCGVFGHLLDNVSVDRRRALARAARSPHRSGGWLSLSSRSGRRWRRHGLHESIQLVGLRRPSRTATTVFLSDCNHHGFVFLSYSRFSYRADVVHIRREMSTIMTGGGLRERSFENDFGPAFPLNHR